MLDTLNVEYTPLSSDSCELELSSNVKGQATTYAMLFRRALLQSTSNVSVAGFRVKSDNTFAKNQFDVVSGMTKDLLEVYMALHNAKFDIPLANTEEMIILTLKMQGANKLSDISNPNKCSVTYGSLAEGCGVTDIILNSEDISLGSIVGDRDVTIDIFLRSGIGYATREDNQQYLTNALGESDVKNWIITDSQHRGVMSVSYKEEQHVEKQVIKLGIQAFNGDVQDKVVECIDNVVANLKLVRNNIITPEM